MLYILKTLRRCGFYCFLYNRTLQQNTVKLQNEWRWKWKNWKHNIIILKRMIISERARERKINEREEKWRNEDLKEIYFLSYILYYIIYIYFFSFLFLNNNIVIAREFFFLCCVVSSYFFYYDILMMEYILKSFHRHLLFLPLFFSLLS